MHWKKREREIARLRAKHAGQRYRVPIPDLKVEQRTAPLGNGFDKTEGRREKGRVPGLIVDHLHKQGMQVISKEDVQWAGGRKPN